MMPLDLDTTKPWRRVQFRTEDNLQGLTVTGGIDSQAPQFTSITLPYGCVFEDLLSDNTNNFFIRIQDNFKRRYLEGDDAFSPIRDVTSYFGNGIIQPARYRRIMDDPRMRTFTMEQLAANLGAFKDTELVFAFRKSIAAEADIWLAAMITTGWTNLPYVTLQTQLADPEYWRRFHKTKARWSATRQVVLNSLNPSTGLRINVLGDTMITGVQWSGGANIQAQITTSFLRRNTGLSNNPIRIDFLGAINTPTTGLRNDLWPGVMYAQWGEDVILEINSLDPDVEIIETITVTGYQANANDMDLNYQTYYLSDGAYQ